MNASEKRLDRRQRVLKGGRILFNAHNSSVDCAIRDMSEHGARLKLDSPVVVPESFDLYVRQNDMLYPARIAWRKMQEIGVEFVGAPYPMRDYGRR